MGEKKSVNFISSKDVMTKPIVVSSDQKSTNKTTKITSKKRIITASPETATEKATTTLVSTTPRTSINEGELKVPKIFEMYENKTFQTAIKDGNNKMGANSNETLETNEN